MIMKQAVSVVALLHRENLFHRDIKLNNFVVHKSERWDSFKDLDNNNCIDLKVEVKLIDFDFVDFIHKEQKHAS